MTSALVVRARQRFHKALLKSVLMPQGGVPGNADKHSVTSVMLAKGILKRLGKSAAGTRLAGQIAGAQFEEICAEFVRETFPSLERLRPGTWEIKRGGSEISEFDQYQHLALLDKLSRANPELATALGSDYLITPDVLIVRFPEEDAVINRGRALVDDEHARLTSLRKVNGGAPILHASISCKWTLRSDRAQNARSEALNLVRNRKGRLPHVVIVTGEPTPTRIASIALGTGDIDCVYHFALPELVETVKELEKDDHVELLQAMIKGKRLRDISDLPLDLVV
jgi:NgoMIV restriction enzyme